ncbi:MAG: sortase [Ilumatobacter sp.]
MSDTEVDPEARVESLDADSDDLDLSPVEEPARPRRPTRAERRGRISKWDRTPPPRDWRWYTGSLGKILITVGLLMFAFVGYQLYGTGLETAAAQNRLEDDFEAQLAQFDVVEPVVDSTEENTGVDVAPAPDIEQGGDTGLDDGLFDDASPGDTGGEQPADTAEPDASEPAADVASAPAAVPVGEQVIPDLEDGDALARIEIPALGEEHIVVAGVDKNDLKKGPGHFPDTPLPGQLGNSAIAGHRTTYGEPFRNVDRLAPGDVIRVTTLNGAFTYRVTETQIVAPSDYQVVATSDPTVASLTLVSCHPVFTARERIIVSAVLDPDASNDVGEAVLNYGRPDEPAPASELPGEDVVDEPLDAVVVSDPSESEVEDPDEIVVSDPSDPTGESGAGDAADAAGGDTDLLGSEEVNAGIADAFSDGWFSDPGANPQVGLWGLILGTISLAAYFVSRRFRRDWVGLAVGIIPFLGALYFFFQNVIRLLPPNL